MDGNMIQLIILTVIGILLLIKVSHDFPIDFMKTFEDSCEESINKRNQEIEEKEKLYSELRKWLFK